MSFLRVPPHVTTCKQNSRVTLRIVENRVAFGFENLCYRCNVAKVETGPITEISKRVNLQQQNQHSRSEEQEDNADDAKPAAICNVVECSKLFNPRLEAMEMAVKKIALAILSQTSDVFAPIKEILEEDPTFTSILSLNSTIYSSSTKAPSVSNGTHKEDGQKQEKNFAVANLKRAVKCSLAHLVDINLTDPEPYYEPLPQITALFTKDILKIEWSVPSAECVKVSSGVRIKIYESADGYKVPLEAPIFVPQKCIKKIAKTWHSINLASPFSSSTSRGKACAFSLTKNLTQCRSYIVEVVINYQSLAGKAMQTELVIPPKLNEKAHLKPLISASARSSSLTLNWEDNSGCAPQLTSLNLEIFQDGMVDKGEKANATVVIPRSCFKQPIGEGNLFSLTLPTSELTCPIVWKPLDVCRKYKINMSSQYSSTWNGPSSSSEIFTEQEGNFAPDSPNVFLRCPIHQFYCQYQQLCMDTSNVCYDDNNGYDGCESENRYCEQDVCYKGGFRCGQQCIPKELVCNGNFDCVDGSDEGPHCENTCFQLTNPSGNFSSQKFHMPPYEIHRDKIVNTAQNTKVLISVQSTHHIWLTFNKFNTFQNQHIVKVYDGPYSTSPLLLSHNGSTKPYSVRSSSSDLFVEFPSYWSTTYGIEAFYTSVRSTDDQFLPGCGGYIYGDGIIPKSLATTFNTGCFWYIEATQSDDTLLLKTNISDSDAYRKLNFYRTLMVYDGWNTDGLVLYDGKEDEFKKKVAIYSITHKVMVHIKIPIWTTTPNENLDFSWWITTQKSTPHCNNHFEENTGTIKSPNYPTFYPNSVDCRWNIKVEPGSKVRLLFALFETQADADYLYVYDGPTLRSTLLLTKSGLLPTPFIVNSSTNQVLVRFVSDEDTSSPGFLAVYSSV
ncbi:uncharacterized protein LOC116935922 isoform X2 [Daphnia magna]|uniref:uncharacterized protein LOC116935922 isoform X2 n=1 Tax=Daphnia magna TaxID=35525 RepID=UPI001E1BD72D|nr:uncharacterized protein LOC116935922 isoform X2 [Daphnia magna]